jgi:menaquinone-dependent protoporphyrinogen oxidase
MRLFVLYATTEGQTRKIAKFVAEHTRTAGHDVTLMDVLDAPEQFPASDYDGAIIAASVHVGRYQSSIQHFVMANLDALSRLPTLFLSVSLAAAGDEDDRKDIDACLDRFQQDTGWISGRVTHVAGAFRYTQYDFFKRWAMKFIAMRHGQPTDTSRDYELTDWAALEKDVDDFLKRVGG